MLEDYKEVLKKMENSKSFFAIGYGINGYLLGLANNEYSLRQLVSRYDIAGLIIDGDESVDTSNNVSLDDSNIEVYAMKHLQLSVTEEESKQDLWDNRWLVGEFYYQGCRTVLANCETREISTRELFGKESSSLSLFTMKRGNLVLHVTRHQMCLETKQGLVKIHDSESDVDFKHLLNILYMIFDYEKNEEKTVIKGALEKY